MTKDHANKNLQDFADILDRLAVPFILDGGTLLGAYRDKDFCEDDWDDIDLTTFDQFSVSMDTIIAEAKKIGFQLYKQWLPDLEKTGQIAMKRDGIKVDLMFKKRRNQLNREDTLWWTVYRGKGVVYKSVPFALASPFSVDSNGRVDDSVEARIEFKGRKYRIPARIDEYLSYRYGDWTKKVHRSEYSCYTTDQAIVQDYYAV